LALIALAQANGSLTPDVHDLPRQQDVDLANLKLATVGAGLDVLTEEQILYRDDYSAGT
jgi:S-adenosylhomocysteine hydrolase